MERQSQKVRDEKKLKSYNETDEKREGQKKTNLKKEMERERAKRRERVLK